MTAGRRLVRRALRLELFDESGETYLGRHGQGRLCPGAIATPRGNTPVGAD